MGPGYPKETFTVTVTTSSIFVVDATNHSVALAMQERK